MKFVHSRTALGQDEALLGRYLDHTIEKPLANQGRQKLWISSLILHCIMGFIIIYLISKCYFEHGTGSQVLYSPAETAIRFEDVTFHSNLGNDLSVYSGQPSEKVDTAWENLYNRYAVSRISEYEANLLHEPTIGISNDPGYYVVSLDVFHQLHCLNYIRKRLYPSYYVSVHNLSNSQEQRESIHLVHCIDSLRQTLMCTADISVIPFRWEEQQQRPILTLNSTHTCRNFDTIRKWADDHQLKPGWDFLGLQKKQKAALPS